MKYLSILSLLLSVLFGFAQKPANNPIDIELSLLISRKAQYEKWRDKAKITSYVNNANKYAYRRDSVYQLYMEVIKKVKSSPQVYLVHINKAIKAGKVDYNGAYRIIYNYFNQSLSSTDWDLYFLTRLEAYKIIKRSLFEKNESQLPERTDLYIKKEVRGVWALLFHRLMQRIPLSQEEIKKSIKLDCYEILINPIAFIIWPIWVCPKACK